MLSIRQILKWSKDPERLRAEAAALREQAEREAERRASEGPSDEEFRSWTPEEQAAYLERIAETAEREREEQARAERYAEVEEAIADVETAMDADVDRGAELLSSLTQLLGEHRDRYRRLHELRVERATLGGPRAPAYRPPVVADFGARFEALGEQLTGRERELHHEVLTSVDPQGTRDRRDARSRDHARAQQEHTRATETIERMGAELDELKRAKLITYPSRDGMEGGTYLTLGDRRWFDIRTERQHKERIARVEETIAKAKETAARTAHAAVQSTLTPSTPQDTGDLSVNVGGPRLFQAKL